MDTPQTQYARSGDLDIAYQVIGSGPPVVVIPPIVSNIEIYWEHESLRRVLEHWARHVTYISFDKRGIGSSDRFDELPTLEQRIEDITAVMDAVGVERASLVGLSEGGLMSQLFAATYPERVDKLVLVNSACGLGGPWALSGEELVKLFGRFERLKETWGKDPQYMVDWFCPSRSADPSVVSWTGRLQRMSASPADFARQLESVMVLEAPDLSAIRALTLVNHVIGDRVVSVESGKALAANIAGAELFLVEGDDHFPWLLPEWRRNSDVLLEFITGERPGRPSEQRFASVLFTDVVGSTASSAAAGDERWTEVLLAHGRVCDTVLGRWAGTRIKNTGDGILATFPDPVAAVSAAAELVRELGSVGLEIRAGVHAGVVEVHPDGDVSGVTVNLAARVESAANPGSVFVSSTVRDQMLGTDHRFDDRGEFELKGIPGRWRLYALEP